MTEGRRNGGEMRVGGRGGWVEDGEAETEKGKHMWKTLQCGSGHSRSSWCVLLELLAKG